MRTNIERYLVDKTKKILDISCDKNIGLHNDLLSALISNATNYYHLSANQVNEARLIVQNVVDNFDKNRETVSVILPEDWKDVIKERTNLTSFKQLTKKEVDYHKKYCIKSKCAFGPNELCPVCKFSN